MNDVMVAIDTCLHDKVGEGRALRTTHNNKASSSSRRVMDGEVDVVE